jgi:hypothetical protein
VALWGRYTRGVQPTTRGVQPTTRDHTRRATYHTRRATYHTRRATYHTRRAYNTRHWTCARVDVIRGERGEQWVGEELHGDGQDRLVLHSHEARGIVPKRRTASLTKRQMTSRADDILNVRRKGTQQLLCSRRCNRACASLDHTLRSRGVNMKLCTRCTRILRNAMCCSNAALLQRRDNTVACGAAQRSLTVKRLTASSSA